MFTPQQAARQSERRTAIRCVERAAQRPVRQQLGEQHGSRLPASAARRRVPARAPRTRATAQRGTSPPALGCQAPNSASSVAGWRSDTPSASPSERPRSAGGRWLTSSADEAGHRWPAARRRVAPSAYRARRAGRTMSHRLASRRPLRVRIQRQAHRTGQRTRIHGTGCGSSRFSRNMNGRGRLTTPISPIVAEMPTRAHRPEVARISEIQRSNSRQRVAAIALHALQQRTQRADEVEQRCGLVADFVDQRRGDAAAHHALAWHTDDRDRILAAARQTRACAPDRRAGTAVEITDQRRQIEVAARQRQRIGGHHVEARTATRRCRARCAA